MMTEGSYAGSIVLALFHRSNFELHILECTNPRKDVRITVLLRDAVNGILVVTLLHS